MEKNKDIVTSAVNYAIKHDMDVVELSENLEDANIPEGTHHDVIYDIGVEEWLWYMQHAEYIITNSFHACCFSVIFRKQFFAGARSGDKIDSVLDLFDLGYRRIIKDSQLSNLDKIKEIDFDKVHETMNRLIEESGSFILNAIHELENRGHKPIADNPQGLIERAAKNATTAELKADFSQEKAVSSENETESFIKRIWRKLNG